jgi:hypothetical protein
MYTTLRAAAFVGLNFHHSVLVQRVYLSERRPAEEVVDGDGMVQTRDSLGKDLLALDSSSLDLSCDIVEGDSAHNVAHLDDMGHGRVVGGLGAHT